jgi:indole-3-glycerol phosphate synthase
MTILDTILADNRDALPRRRRERPISSLSDEPLFAQERRQFRESLRVAPEVAIIAEIKHRSPSKGVLREHFVPADIARRYEDSGASALSVLTEPFHFGGDLTHLSAVRTAVDLPLLRKDFIFDPYQIYEARAHGADAILLIAEALADAQFEELLSAAGEIGLDVLVEIHEREYIETLNFDRVRLLGVNNRDLRTFDVDINHAVSLLSEVPSDVVRVAESGIRTPDDLLLIGDGGIDAALIGETFMRAENPGDALSRLRETYLQLLEERNSYS